MRFPASELGYQTGMYCGGPRVAGNPVGADVSARRIPAGQVVIEKLLTRKVWFWPPVEEISNP